MSPAQDGGSCHAPDILRFASNLSFHCAFRATPVNMIAGFDMVA
jgi:hypothetical protein